MYYLWAPLENAHARKFSNLFGISLTYLYLCHRNALHSTAQAAAMAQKHIRLCAYLLQQQSVEARLLLAHARGVCIILYDFELHLLFQRSPRRWGRSTTSKEMPSPDCFRKSLCQRWLRDDAAMYDSIFRIDSVGDEPQYTLFIYNSGGLLADEHRLLHPTEANRHSRRVDYCSWIRDARIGRRCNNRHLDLPLAGDDDFSGSPLPGLHQTKRRLPHLWADGHQTSSLDYWLQQDLHQRGHSHHRFSHTSLLHHVHHVARGYQANGHPLCLPHQRLGSRRPPPLSPEHDCLWPQRFPHEIPRQGPLHPALHPRLDCLVLCYYLFMTLNDSSKESGHYLLW